MTKYASLMISAIQMVGYTGLSLNHTKNEATLVGKKRGRGSGCFFMPLYGGLLKTAKVEGSVLGADAQVIYDKDIYKINAGARTNKVYHEMKSFDKTDKPLVTWCVLYLPSGIEQLAIVKEYDYQQMKSMGVKAIHDKWGDQFRIKSALKRALKLITSEKSSKLKELIAYDNTHFDFDAIENPQEEPPKKEEPKKNKENPTGLPIFNKNHKQWSKAVLSLVNESQSVGTLREHVYISVGVEKDLLAAVEAEKKKSNSSNPKTPANV